MDKGFIRPEQYGFRNRKEMYKSLPFIKNYIYIRDENLIIKILNLFFFFLDFKKKKKLKFFFNFF